MPNGITKKDAETWFALVTKFRKDRTRKWAPRIYKAIIQMIKDACNEPTIGQAIANLERNMNLQPLQEILISIYVDSGRVMGGHAYQSINKQGVKALMPIGDNEAIINEIIAFMKLHSLQMVTEINETLRDWILVRLMEAQRQAKSIAQAVDEMVRADFPRNRSIVIARTEVIKSANFGAVAGAKKAKYKTRKMWIATKDHRTRRTPRDKYNHLAMDGIVVEMHETFKVPKKTGGVDELQQPGDPSGDAGDVIQCRCTVAFPVIRNANGTAVPNTRRP